ncbi:unnamed protein product, partial [Ceratitis capitata]
MKRHMADDNRQKRKEKQKFLSKKLMENLQKCNTTNLCKARGVQFCRRSKSGRRLRGCSRSSCLQISLPFRLRMSHNMQPGNQVSPQTTTPLTYSTTSVRVENACVRDKFHVMLVPVCPYMHGIKNFELVQKQTVTPMDQKISRQFHLTCLQSVRSKLGFLLHDVWFRQDGDTCHTARVTKGSLIG